jgi:peroxiredoxin
LIPEAEDHAPDFALPAIGGEIHLRELTERGQVLLAFYYEDDTPLCISELTVFKEDYEIIEQLDTQVVALSADSLESHRAFAERLGGLPFPLASDERLEAATAYGVVDDSGKRSRRAVFVIGRGGKILLAERWFQPGNPSQYEAIFAALGFEA